MRTYDEINADAKAGTPFSNHSSFEVWAANTCAHGSGCVHDGVWGGGPRGAECQLITVSLSEKTPKEWTERTDQIAIDSQHYNCTAYEEVVAYATDDEPADENPDAYLIEPHWRTIETINGQEGLF